MPEPTENEKLSGALNNVANLGFPIRELVESIKDLKKSVDELIAVQREHQQQ